FGVRPSWLELARTGQILGEEGRGVLTSGALRTVGDVGALASVASTLGNGVLLANDVSRLGWRDAYHDDDAYNHAGATGLGATHPVGLATTVGRGVYNEGAAVVNAIANGEGDVGRALNDGGRWVGRQASAVGGAVADGAAAVGDATMRGARAVGDGAAAVGGA